MKDAKTAKIKNKSDFLCFSPLVYGNDIPRLINYEGTLSKDGELVPDGSYDMEFNIYNAETRHKVLISSPSAFQVSSFLKESDIF